MDNNRRRRESEDDDDDNSTSWWGIGLGLAAVGAGAGLVYLASRSLQEQPPESPDSDDEEELSNNMSMMQIQHEMRKSIMDNNRRRRESEDDDDDQRRRSTSWWGIGLGLAAVGVGAGLVYLASRSSQEQPPESPDSDDEEELSNNMSMMQIQHEMRGIRPPSNPPNPPINNINSLLSDIYVRFIALREEDFATNYSIAHSIVHELHSTMKTVDPYYDRFSQGIHYTGSHRDRLRIKTPDEFDMNIVIGIPVSMKESVDPRASDIVFQDQNDAFVHLKTGKNYQDLWKNPTDWDINVTAYKWMDEEHFLRSSKFREWFQGVLDLALNEHLCPNNYPELRVAGKPYKVSRKQSGPAMTLCIKGGTIKIDVDLVPALRFHESRWPISPAYRKIPARGSADQPFWLVVPKPNKSVGDPHKSRSWRIALHDQEHKLMYDSENLKQTIRLMKKLLDAQNMKEIVSYFLKTVFFYEAIDKVDQGQYWRQSPAELFKIMVKKLTAYLEDHNIPYFWNHRHNLIGNVSRQRVSQYYVVKLKGLIQILETPHRYKEVAKYLLSDSEYRSYADILEM